MPHDVVDLSQFRHLFFFSYARLEQDKYLQRFFDDLCATVTRKVVHMEPSFRDLDQIAPGDHWPTRLIDALQASQTLLCIYSPTYFKREYCGKEFTVFLQRQGVAMAEDDVARGSQRIIPVLWMRQNDLERLKLPPAMLRAIHYTVKSHTKLYIDLGLGGIMRRNGRRSPYHAIVDELADGIIDRCTSALPPLPDLTDLERVPNAFAVPSAPQPGGPNILRLFYVTSADEAAAHPRDPLLPAHIDALGHLVAEVVLQLRMQFELDTIDPADAAAGKQFAADVLAATARNETVLVLARASVLTPAAAVVLHAVAATAGLRGGIMVIAGPDDQAADTLAAGLTAAQAAARDDAERMTVRAFAGSNSEFRVALAGFLSQLKRRSVATGAVCREISTAGPDRKPIVAGPRAEGRT
jgi:hypothetical protein